jgi:phosphotransferase system HPr (HPr) family protein
VTVLNRLGLHARPATLLSVAARKFQCQIELVGLDGSELGGKRADAKSTIDVMFFGAPPGTTLDLEAVGPDAEAAVQEIASLFLDRFGIRED